MANAEQPAGGKNGRLDEGNYPRMKSILVPLDFSPVSKRVTDEALHLARALKARLVFIHVVQLPVIVTDYAGMTLEDTAILMSDARHSAARHLVKLRARLRTLRVNAGTILETGAPVPCIIEEARRLKASHIVIGSHGHTAFFDLLIGSTTCGVLKRSPCPVVVVPAASPIAPPRRPKARA